MDGPNPFKVLISILRARRVRTPDPQGDGTVDHSLLKGILGAVADHGVAGLSEVESDLAAYVKTLGDVNPDELSRDEALAYWLNLYNAGALDLARRTWDAARGTVLRTPGGFDAPFVTVAGEDLSLDAIEHGKIRRFGDPRIHGALVCGSVSCPTMRPTPFTGAGLDAELDDQLRRFLAAGGATADRTEGVLRISRVFLWYGADFVRPHRMPTLLPASKRATRDALHPWLPDDMVQWVDTIAPKVAFQAYDWSLGCSVG